MISLVILTLYSGENLGQKKMIAPNTMICGTSFIISSSQSCRFWVSESLFIYLWSYITTCITIYYLQNNLSLYNIYILHVKKSFPFIFYQIPCKYSALHLYANRLNAKAVFMQRFPKSWFLLCIIHIILSAYMQTVYMQNPLLYKQICEQKWFGSAYMQI